MLSTKELLTPFAEGFRSLAAPGRPPTLYEFVLDNGRECQVPKDGRAPWLIPRHCFANCHSLQKRRPDKYLYWEGYAFLELGFPVHHAWLTGLYGELVIEPTCENFVSYYGIPFTAEYCQAFRKSRGKNGGMSILDDWHRGFPVQKLSATELAKIIEPANGGQPLTLKGDATMEVSDKIKQVVRAMGDGSTWTVTNRQSVPARLSSRRFASLKELGWVEVLSQFRNVNGKPVGATTVRLNPLGMACAALFHDELTLSR